MKTELRLVLAVALSGVGAPAAVGADAACPAAGEPVQWIADYCMLKMETDDEIAVSGCIEEESRKSFAGSCASNLHFKTAMCEAMVRHGTKPGSVRQCVADPAFKGRVVESGGVGGAAAAPARRP